MFMALVEATKPYESHDEERRGQVAQAKNEAPRTLTLSLVWLHSGLRQQTFGAAQNSC